MPLSIRIEISCKVIILFCFCLELATLIFGAFGFIFSSRECYFLILMKRTSTSVWCGFQDSDFFFNDFQWFSINTSYTMYPLYILKTIENQWNSPGCQIFKYRLHDSGALFTEISKIKVPAIKASIIADLFNMFVFVLHLFSFRI